MQNNPVQFAIVREDPSLEAQVIQRTGARRVLLIASGGCTALSLQALYPDLEMVLVDPNPAQLELIRKKISALRSLEGRERELAFGIESDDPRALNACGNFESLFRQLRLFWEEFVFSDGQIRGAFESGVLSGLLAHARANSYWKVSFELLFSNSILNAMFGPEATQHAPPGSYPAYFQSVFERGMASPGSAENRFLQHVFLGCYRRAETSLPPYLSLPVPREHRFEMFQGRVDSVSDFGGFDVVSLSNIFDWTAREEVASVASRLAKEMKPGAMLIFRQLNHSTDFQSLFGEAFSFDEETAERVLREDQSLFYSRFNIGERRC